jgi:plasmid rolling circle replication initiator protein Rep
MKKSKKDGKKNISTIAAILEAAKYTTKSNDYLIRNADGEIDTAKTDEAVKVISDCLYRRRLVSYGGVFKQAHKALHLDNIEDGDLLHTEIEAQKALKDSITFQCVWKGKAGYKVTPIINNIEKGQTASE